MKININIIETRDIGNDEVKAREVRLVDIDGVRHLQMMGAEHEAMHSTWCDGVIMVCPATLTLDEVASDPELYYRGYGDGCEVCDDIPQELS